MKNDGKQEASFTQLLLAQLPSAGFDADYSEKFCRSVRELISPPDESIRQACQRRWDSLCKPIGGMGVFEDITAQIAAIKGELIPSSQRAAVVIMGADNGVTDEGISQCGYEVTAQVMKNMTKGLSTVCVIAESMSGPAGELTVFPVDVGVRGTLDCPGIIDMKIRQGSGNIAKEDAMTAKEAVRAVLAGMDTALMMKDKGYDILIAGDMGIGNTTSSTAVLCAVTGSDPAAVTGYGAGLSEEGRAHKADVIKRAIEIHGFTGRRESDPFRILSKVGGLDIAAICGLYLGAAACSLPVLIDGYVTAAAALLAAMIAPASRDYMIASHISTEPGSLAAFKELGFKAPLDAGMHLGEAAGAVSFWAMLRHAIDLYKRLPAFEDGKIEAYKRFYTSAAK